MKTLEILEEGKYRARIWDNDGLFTVSCFKIENSWEVIHFPTFYKHFKKLKNAHKQADKFFAWASS